MKRVAIVQNGKVINVVVLEDDAALSPDMVEGPDAAPGDDYINGKFVKQPDVISPPDPKLTVLTVTVDPQHFPTVRALLKDLEQLNMLTVA